MKNNILLCAAFAVFGALAVSTTVMTSNSPPITSGFKTVNAAEMMSPVFKIPDDIQLSGSLLNHIDVPKPTVITDTIRDTVHATICDIEVVAKSKKRSIKKSVSKKEFEKEWIPHKNTYVPDTCDSVITKKVEFDTLYVSKPVLVIPVRNDTIVQ